MAFPVQYLDLILVPPGLFIMFTYHLYLIFRVLRYPATTVIGYENHNRMAWVANMMKDGSNTSVAISVISNNTTGAIYLSVMTLTVSSLVGAWLGSSSGSLSTNIFILGDTSSAIVSLKYICLLLDFLLAFGAFVQSARYFVEANVFISTPSIDMQVKYVQSSVIRANTFWQIGFRLLYFALAFLFWSFGPIPMFASCLIMVVLLSFLDSNSVPLHHYRPVAKPPVKNVMEDV